MFGNNVWGKRKRMQIFLLIILSICALLWLTDSPATFLTMECLPKALQSFTPIPAEVESRKKKGPILSVDPRIWLKYKGQTWEGLQLPVITAEPSGRLGNIMGEYGSLYGIRQAYNATVRLHPYVDGYLKSIYPNLSIPLLPGEYKSEEWMKIVHVASSSYGGIEVAAAGLFGPRRIAAIGSHFEFQLFNGHRQEIIREFTFSTEIQHKVQDFWQRARISGVPSVYVGFHIRRTDYSSFMHEYRSELPGHLYFWNAMEYYRNKFSDVLFVVASDDLGFAKTALANYTDVIYAPGTSGTVDLAILASCNHSIITVGSYGFWSGYLAGGLVVYPNITVRENYLFFRKYYEAAGLDFFIMMDSD